MSRAFPHAFVFALLQGLLIFSLALPFTVMPLLALKLLGGDQQVSMFYLEVGVASMGARWAFPILLEKTGRVRMLLIGLPACWPRPRCSRWPPCPRSMAQRCSTPSAFSPSISFSTSSS